MISIRKNCVNLASHQALPRIAIVPIWINYQINNDYLTWFSFSKNDGCVSRLIDLESSERLKMNVWIPSGPSGNVEKNIQYLVNIVKLIFKHPVSMLKCTQNNMTQMQMCGIMMFQRICKQECICWHEGIFTQVFFF